MLTRREMMGAAAAPLLAAAKGKPNIVLIVSDDHHWQCMGAAGNPNVSTPNLDSLARRGVMFTDGVISTPQCAPSRGILLSGQESYQNGLDSNRHTGFRSFNGATVVEQMRRGGYETNLVGKWHIDPSPKACGFTSAPRWLKPASSDYIDPMLRHGLDATEDTKTAGHITEIWTQSAVDVIAKARQPYLLWLTYNAPHQPWTASERFTKMYAGRNAILAPPAHPKPVPPDPRFAMAKKGGGKKGGKKGGGAGGSRADGVFDWETYYAVISELDAGIGRVVEAVEKSGQWDNTLILFIGDNGFLCGSKGLNGKVFPWEESIRIPFIAAGGLVSRAGKSDAPVASIDVPATMLDYAGIRSSHKMTGSSIRSAIEGKKFARDASFACWNDGAVEALYAGYPVEPYRAARTSAAKYIVWESKKEALFDLRNDRFEEKNLAADAAHAGMLKQMKEKMRRRMRETSDPAIAWL